MGMLKSRVLIPDAPFCSHILNVSLSQNSVISELFAHLFLLNCFPPTPELGEVLPTCSVPEGVLLTWFFSGHAFFFLGVLL